MITPSKVLCFCCLAVTAGVVIESFATLPQALSWGIFLLTVSMCLAAVFLKKPAIAVSGLLALCLLLGITRTQLAQSMAANEPLHQYNNGAKPVTLTGIIVASPDVRQKDQLLKLRIDRTHSLVLITDSRARQHHYLDRVEITGKLEAPKHFNDFNYQGYLMKDGIYSTMSFPKITLINAGAPHNLAEYLQGKAIWLREKMIDSINQDFPPPKNMLLTGMLLGENGNIPDDLRQSLQESGMRWLTAVAGLHIMIAAWIIELLLLWLGLWRRQACLISIVFLWTYVVLVGFPASALRAGVMGSALLITQWLGRQHSGIRLLALASAIILLENPLLLRYDAGFQLSFLASMGILLSAPLVNAFLAAPNAGSLRHAVATPIKAARFLLSACLVTTAIQLFTLPILIYAFGGIAWVSPLANLLIIPAVPILLASALLGSVVGIIFPFLGWVFFIPSQALLNYFLWVISTVRQPLFPIQINTWGLAAFLIYYAVLIAAAFLLGRKWQPEFL